MTYKKSNTLDDFKNLDGLRARHSFLKNIPYSIDDWTSQQLSGYVPVAPSLDALALRTQLQRLSVLTERVFARRNEIQDISVRAFSRAVEADRNQILLKFSVDILRATSQIDRLNEAAKTSKSVEAAFKKVSGNDGAAQSAKAHAVEAAGLTVLTSQTIVSEKDRESAVQQSIVSMEQLEAAISDAHKHPTGPLNYSRRIDRLKGLLIQDYKEAIDFEDLVSRGMRTYGLPYSIDPLPVDSPELVWELADRVRRATREYDIDSGRRVTINVPISLTYLVDNTNDFPDAQQNVRQADMSVGNMKDWVEKIQNRFFYGQAFEFDLVENQNTGSTSEFWIGLDRVAPGYKAARLLGVGAKIMISTGIRESRLTTIPAQAAEMRQRQSIAVANKLPIYCDVNVLPPTLPDDTKARPPIFLVDVPTSSDAVSSRGVAGPDVESRGVFGTWKISMPKFFVQSGHGPLGLESLVGLDSGVLKGLLGFLRPAKVILPDLRPSLDSGCVFFEGITLYLQISVIPE
jgi:hypothetical protein